MLYTVRRKTSSGSDDYFEIYDFPTNSICDNAKSVWIYAEGQSPFGAGAPIYCGKIKGSENLIYWGTCVDEPIGCRVVRTVDNDSQTKYIICGDFGRAQQWATAYNVVLMTITVLDGVFAGEIRCKE